MALFSQVDKMLVTGSPSTVSLDHLYAKKVDLPDEDDFFASSSDFLSTWNYPDNISSPDEDNLLNLLFGQDFADFNDASPPHSESTSSDSDLTSSPCTVDDAELSEILSSTTTSPEFSQTKEDFTIDLGWNMDFDLPEVEGNKDDEEFTTITSSLPSSVTSSVVTVSQTSIPVCVTTVSSAKKSKVLVLSSEEQRLLEVEGVTLPTDMPLTKAEEKVLKKVRRKIKNKESAQESRRKKKEYVDGLEERVKTCTELNHNLTKKVASLEKQNKSLLDQLKELQALVASTHPTKAQAGTCLMVLFLAFGLVLFPFNNNMGEHKKSMATYASGVVRSRTLLQVADEYITDQEDFPEPAQFNLNSSDYLKAATPLISQSPLSSEVTVEVSDIEKSHKENQIKSQKR